MSGRVRRILTFFSLREPREEKRKGRNLKLSSPCLPDKQVSLQQAAIPVQIPIVPRSPWCIPELVLFARQWPRYEKQLGGVRTNSNPCLDGTAVRWFRRRSGAMIFPDVRLSRATSDSLVDSSLLHRL